MEIKDSGTRKEFNTGAVRDIQECKGRMDLIPIDSIVYDCLGEFRLPILEIKYYLESKDIEYLRKCIYDFILNEYKDYAEYSIALSKHFEAGCKKYGENNWRKGIPAHCYLNSALRHYVKFGCGWDDEPHGIAFAWNIECLIWTLNNKPELDDIDYEGLVGK